MRLINAPEAAEAYSFGFGKIVPVLREYWWFYLLSAAFNAVGIWSNQPIVGAVSSILEAFVIFPMLASCARLLRSDARMRFIDVIAIIAIYLCTVVCVLCAFSLVAASMFILRPLAFIVLIVGFCCLVWLAIKLSAAPLFYLWAEQRNVFQALRDSFRFVSSAEWWAVFMLDVFICLTLVIPAAIFAVIAFSALSKGGGSTQLAVATIVASLLNIAVSAWSTAGIAGIISHAKPPSPSLVEDVA